MRHSTHATSYDAPGGVNMHESGGGVASDDTVLQKVDLGGGTVVTFEARSLDREQQTSTKLPSFDDVALTITSLAQSLSGAITAAKPQKASVEFGVEVAVESGQLTALIVKGGAKANLKITLTWGS
jgi:hypothetical protein